MDSLPPLDQFMLDGIEAGRALGLPHNIQDSDNDLVWETACELRDAANYIEGRLMQKHGEMEGMHLRVALSMIRGVWRVLDKAREYQMRGGV